MKKKIALILVLALSLSLVSCSPIIDGNLTSEELSSETSEVSETVSEPSRPRRQPEGTVSMETSSEPASETSSETVREWDLTPEKIEHYRNGLKIEKNLRLCDVQNGELLEKTRLFLSYLDAFVYFERDENNSNENGFDLSTQMIIYAMYFVEKASDEDIQRWQEEYRENDKFIKYAASYLKKADVDRFVKEHFCDDMENVNFNKLSKYYCEPVEHYAVPILDNYTVKKRVLMSFEETDEQLKVGYKFLYYDGLDPDENIAVNAGSWEKTIGMVNDEGFFVDREEFDSLPIYEFTFCKDGDSLKLHSIHTK